MSNSDKLVDAGVFDLRYASNEQIQAIDGFSDAEVETLIELKRKYFGDQGPVIISPCFF